MEVETDAVPSPARPPKDDKDSAEPKFEGQEQNVGSEPKVKVAVQAEAVPSPARLSNSQTTTSKGAQLQAQVDHNEGIPGQAPSQDENKTHKKNGHKSSRSSFEGPPQPQHCKSKAHKKTRSSTSNNTVQNLQFNGCSNVIIGSVFNINPTNGKTEEVPVDKVPSEPFKKLIMCSLKVDSRDLSIISQYMTENGLQHLFQELEIDTITIEKIVNEHKSKTQDEVTYQILNHWKELNSGKDSNSSPMLNILCKALLLTKVYKNGGKEALTHLQQYHRFSDV